MTVKSAVQACVGPFFRLALACVGIIAFSIFYSPHHISQSTCGLVAMTSASHAEGRQFDPGQVYFSFNSQPMGRQAYFVIDQTQFCRR